MATVTQGASTTSTRNAASRHKVAGVTLTEKVEKENAFEKPVVYVSTEGKNSAWVIPPVPIYGEGGRTIGLDEGVRMEFFNGISTPYYLSNPVHRKHVERIDKLIEENWPIVHVLGLERKENGQPLPPLRKWDKLGLDAIKVALTANFTDNYEDNVAILEAGVRYELSKKQPRKDVVKVLEAMVTLEAAEAAEDEDALDVEVAV